MTRILVVEDSATQAQEICATLEADGFATALAVDAERALRFLYSSPFDLVLSDILMPGLSGYDLCRRIKADPRIRHVPVILLTQLTEAVDIISGLECGADNYICKPCDAEHLLGRVRTLLANKRIRHEARRRSAVDLVFMGKAFTITSDRERILDFLASTYEDFTRVQKREHERRLADARRELEREAQRLKEVERLKDELISTVSHELRTPLTSLRGFTELMLSREFPPAKQREFLTVVHRETIRLTNLINDFLDLQRIESGRQVYRFQTTDLTALLREQIAVFAQAGAPHRLVLDAGEGALLAHADPERLAQVASNLLSNAVKFSPSGGDVTVACSRSSGEIEVSVRDQGIGMPPEVLSRLFAKFYRADNAEVRRIGGTGLGLALVKAIVEAHGGRVWVESEVGAGTTVYFTVPAVAPGRSADALPPPAEAS